MPPLRARLLLLSIAVITLGVAFALWRPTVADGFVGRYPNLLNHTWYGPILVLLVPVLMYRASLAVTGKLWRIAGKISAVVTVVLAIVAILKARETVMFT